MKWYFASNDKSSDFFPLIKAAVDSAVKNTTLEPVFLYDGAENELTQWLREKGVKIIPHRVSFYNELKDHYNEEELVIASGTFLRCDIPIIEQDDEFVLYTDCDVLFLKDFECEIKPKYFACAPQSNKRNFRQFNAGVMLMNIKSLRESHDKFIDFIRENIKILSTYDQTAYQIFYGGKSSKLPIIYNYKPYWGRNDKAVILHFHGCKPTTFADEEYLKVLPHSLHWLYLKNPEAFDYYLDIFKKYYPGINYSEDGIKKLKSGEYPIIKRGKRHLLVRIKDKLFKEYKTMTTRFRNN